LGNELVYENVLRNERIEGKILVSMVIAKVFCMSKWESILLLILSFTPQKSIWNKIGLQKERGCK
jgi:hypothetical protein